LEFKLTFPLTSFDTVARPSNAKASSKENFKSYMPFLSCIFSLFC